MNALLSCLLLAQSAAPVRVGKIVGGWEYVWAAYAVTWAILVLYTISLWVRRTRSHGMKA